jgi:hypothetical protein
MGVLLALTLSLVACNPTGATSEPLGAAASSMEGFRDEFIRKLKREAPDLRVKVVSASIVALADPSGEVDHVDVENAYRMMLADPTRRAELLGKLVAMVREGSSGDLAARPERLAIIVRPVDVRVDSGAAGELIGKISQPLAGDLIFILVVNGPTSLRYLQPRDLEVLKMTEAEAWRRAGENLAKLIGQPLVMPLEGSPGLIELGSDSGLGATLLLAPKLCDGSPVLVMSRDHLLAIAKPSPEASKAFWTLAGKAINSDSAFSRTAIVCNDGKWATAAPPKS